MPHNPPALRLEDFFAGTVTGWGVTRSRFGTLQNQFRIECSGAWDEATRCLSMREVYHFDDGHVDTLDWTIERLSPYRYRGNEPRMDGAAEGEQEGNQFRWRYRRRVPQADGSETTLGFDDYFWLQDERVLVAYGSLTKLGVEVSTISAFYVRGFSEQF